MTRAVRPQGRERARAEARRVLTRWAETDAEIAVSDAEMSRLVEWVSALVLDQVAEKEQKLQALGAILLPRGNETLEVAAARIIAERGALDAAEGTGDEG